jgi:hypothetical protein
LIQIVSIQFLFEFSANNNSIRRAIYFPYLQNDLARLAAIEVVCAKCGLKNKGEGPRNEMESHGQVGSENGCGRAGCGAGDAAR